MNYKELQEVTGKPEYYNRMLETMERSKSLVLKEAFFNDKTGNIANVPEHILEKEEEIKSKIAKLETAKYAASNSTKDTLHRDSIDRLINHELFRLNETLLFIEQEYPSVVRRRNRPPGSGS